MNREKDIEWKEIIDNSFDGILVTDKDGIILHGNRAYERNTGVDLSQWIGQNINDYVGPAWFKKTVFQLVVENRTSVSLQHVCQNHKNIIATGTPIFDENGEIGKVLINTRDVTEIYSLREELLKSRENEKKLYLQLMEGGIELQGNPDEPVAVSAGMRQLLRQAERLGGFQTTVLIEGPSGAGKEEVARYIHRSSMRSSGPFVEVNCGAIPENLLESELFGYVEGAFTGALKGGRDGLFQMAEGGTLFLDEIGETSPAFQVKLLRAIETKSIMKVGSGVSIPVDIRIIAATNRNLQQMVKEGRFREDLLYRLSVVRLEIPPLKGRTEDIAALAVKFLDSFNREYGMEKKLSYEVIKELERQEWPGNVRELKNVIENMVVLSPGEYIQVGDLPWNAGAERQQESGDISRNLLPTWKEAMEQEEKRLLTLAKERFHSSRKIGEVLGLDHATVARKLKKYNL
ncbi:MAG: sigma-54 interaction domain-containing protein [Anaerovoracaceae bacterium]